MSITDTPWWIVGLVLIQVLLGLLTTIIGGLAGWALARVYGLSIRVAELTVQVEMQASHVEQKLASLSGWMKKIDEKLDRLFEKNGDE